MDKELFKQKLNEAVTERETGSVEKSLELFSKIDESTLDPDQFHSFVGQRGLTYWHNKDYENAKIDFEKIKKQAKELKNDSYMAVALRQLSRPEFNTNTPDKAVEDSKEAREYAFKSNREDLAWFDHGVVSSLIINKSPKEEIESWFLKETEDIYNISQKTRDEIAKWVWITGLLIDRYKVYNTKADLYTAKIIAEEFKLARRVEQIDKLLEEEI